MNNLLNYFFPITAINPTPAASTAFLKQVCLVVKGKVGVPAGVTMCTTKAQVTALTDNEEADRLFAAGMSRVYIMVSPDLDLEALLEANTQFFTLLISSDFSDANVTGADFGTFKGVVGVSSTDNAFLKAQAAIENRVAFHTTAGNKAGNMCFAFGKLLSNALSWLNQQYITMPLADDVNTKGAADVLFEDKISFVLSDVQYGQRLALFAAGGKAIVAPYILENLKIDIQSKGLSYISGNMPQYTLTNAALLEDELQKVIDLYIEKREIEKGKVEIKLEQENFVASGYINVSEPKALWRVFGQINQTL